MEFLSTEETLNRPRYTASLGFQSSYQRTWNTFEFHEPVEKNGAVTPIIR